MTGPDERLQILKLVEQGRVSAEDGLRLLEALEARERSAGAAPQARWLRIRVTESGASQPTVNLSLPLGLVRGASRLLQPYLPEMPTRDLRDLVERATGERPGKLLEIQDRGGEHVEIFVE